MLAHPSDDTFFATTELATLFLISMRAHESVLFIHSVYPIQYVNLAALKYAVFISSQCHTAG